MQVIQILKKTYDKLNRKYLIKILIDIKAPRKAISFLNNSYVYWNLDLFFNGNNLKDAKLKRGIL